MTTFQYPEFTAAGGLMSFGGKLVFINVSALRGPRSLTNLEFKQSLEFAKTLSGNL
jgi:hypothetical protein